MLHFVSSKVKGTNKNVSASVLWWHNVTYFGSFFFCFCIVHELHLVTFGDTECTGWITTSKIYSNIEKLREISLQGSMSEYSRHYQHSSQVKYCTCHVKVFWQKSEHKCAHLLVQYEKDQHWPQWFSFPQTTRQNSSALLNSLECLKGLCTQL